MANDSTRKRRKCLERMGIRLDEFLTLIKRASTPIANKKANAKGTKQNQNELDITIEHITDLSCGGDNSENNLCLMPEYLNKLKDIFHSCQMYIEPSPTVLLSFAPKKVNGVIPNVPFIEGGFRLKSTYSDWREPTSELFGCQIS